MGGPLDGVRVTVLGGIGPAPYAAMMLADMGAQVTRFTRADSDSGIRLTPLGRVEHLLARGQQCVAVDLKDAEALAVVRSEIDRSDALVEGFRPGVAERLGVGPRECLASNPRLVYGRVTGWGSGGPLSGAAGHDINYIALTGALDAIGTAGGPPAIPLNLIGDYAGGGHLLATGILAALVERSRSGLGQVVEAAMVDGASLLMAAAHAMKAAGLAGGPRGTNLIDGGAHFYSVYECADGKHLAVGCVEPQFYRAFLAGLRLGGPEFDAQFDASRWPALKERVAAVIRTRKRDAWCEHFAATDACVSPVLSIDEAPRHPHAVARGSFVESGGATMPAAAPRFERSRTAAAQTPGEPIPLREWLRRRDGGE